MPFSLNLDKYIFVFFFLEFARTFKAIDQPVKLEPRDQTTSPYLFYAGNYRDTSHATTPPQPLSPPMFMPGNHSPSNNFLQAPNVMSNNFPHQPQYNQSFTPNIQVTTAQFNNGNGVSWTNNLNVNDTASRTFNINNTNNMTAQSSSLFNEQLTPLQNVTPIFSNDMRVSSSFFMDMDSNQLINNLSGELSSLLNLEDGSSFSRIDDMSVNRQTNK